MLGEQGHPLRATVSELGPLLLARLLGLNDTQEGLLLLDLKDLQALIRHVGTEARTYQIQYGNVSAASIGAIQRALLALEQQAGDRFFGEPALNVMDLLQTDANGHGVINILASKHLIQAPKLYATVLLWLLSQLYNQLPEVGDRDQPKLLLVFDEAHLLFDGAPAVLLEKVEQVVRLIRSKGVGIWFCTQNPMDLPGPILGQLGNRVQHALRAFTPAEQKLIEAAATTFRSNPDLVVEEVIGELAVGEALVSFLDAQGTPGVVERAFVVPPFSRVGPIPTEQRQALIAASPLQAFYGCSDDRESAYERLAQRAEKEALQAEKEATAAARQADQEQARQERAWERADAQAALRAEREKERLLLSLAGEAGHALGGRTGRSLARCLMGGLLGRRG